MRVAVQRTAPPVPPTRYVAVVNESEQPYSPSPKGVILTAALVFLGLLLFSLPSGASLHFTRIIAPPPHHSPPLSKAIEEVLPTLSASPTQTAQPSISATPTAPPSEPVLHFSPLAEANPFSLPFGIALPTFTGTRSLHMSSHACQGVYGGPGAEQGWSNCTYNNFFCTDPYTGLYPNRTCRFENLYFAKLSAHPPPYLSYDWFYFAAVTKEEAAAPGWSAAATRARLKAEFRVDLLSRLKQDSWWRIEVVFFLAEPVAGGARARLVRPSYAPLPGGVVAGNPPAATVVDSNDCALFDKSAGNVRYNGSAVACLPPGVGAFTLRTFFFVSFSHHSNIGHTLWDDLVPIMGAARLLQLPLQDGSADLLLTCVPQDHMFRWNAKEPFKSWVFGDQGVRHSFAYTSPGMDPVQLGDVMAEAGDRLVHFPVIAGGLTGMSPHNFRPSHLVFGAEPPLRSVWSLRQHMMRNMNFTTSEIFRSASALPAPSPEHNSSLVIVRGKRGLRNLDSLVADIRAAYPHVQVSTVAWEETGGLVNEARVLSNTQVLMSLDGTA